MTDLTPYLDAANATLTDPERNITVGEGAPRFELYHFALSLCSQKVRLTLAEKGASYVAHDINLSMPHLANYEPTYVRLRMLGAEGRALVSGYTGRSSTDTEGFDPAVVPTLVDREASRVVIDSRRICAYLDAAVDGPALRPPELAETIDAELAIVDRTPHVALFYGALPDTDVRPARLQKGMGGVHDRKIAKIEKARAKAADDAALLAAYDAKIAKESAARTFVGTPEAMRDALSETLAIVADLDERLADGRPYVAGDVYTLADVVWSISLFRLAWLGMAFCWEGGHDYNATPRPHVAAYTARVFDRATFREAAVDWPLAPHSEHVSAYYAAGG